MKFKKKSLAVLVLLLSGFFALARSTEKSTDTSFKASGDKSLVGALTGEGKLSISRFRDGGLKEIISLQGVARYAMSANDNYLAVVSKVNEKIALSIYEARTRELRFQQYIDDLPEEVWLGNEGDVIGIYAGEKFTAYTLDGGGMKKVYSKSSVEFLASASGNFLLFKTEEGYLQIVRSGNWGDVALSSNLVQTAVEEWLAINRPGAKNPGEGPLIFPRKIGHMSFDDRLITIFLGENDQTFINICASTGRIVSTAAYDVRVNVYPDVDESGRYFGVLLTPNSDDSKFQRPSTYFGIRLHEIYGGESIGKIPLKQKDVTEYHRVGTSHFSPTVQWFSFLKAGKTTKISGAMLAGSTMSVWRKDLGRMYISKEEIQSRCPSI
ncbi:hypothetical protein [Variovorax sp. IB41]|uniref:hypothetical protein n=1 Tax=Variovorax sp. IB41 TaxID=2779370 RepID=UPI0018E85477|nr:hypothetical protein [Variovorax sp. IB41]MBJ2159759.1 hypothetical protein [Variovorax sp. IB41]